MKFIIDEQQKYLIGEGEYSIRMKRRKNELDKIIKEILPKVDFIDDENEEDAVDNVIQYFIDNKDLYDNFRDIPDELLYSYIYDNYFNLISKYFFKFYR